MRQAAVTAADGLDSRQEHFIRGCEWLRVTPRLSLPKVDIQPNVNHTSVVGGWKRQSMMKTRCIMWGRREGKWKMMIADTSYHTENTVGAHICSCPLCGCRAHHPCLDCLLHMTAWSHGTNHKSSSCSWHLHMWQDQRGAEDLANADVYWISDIKWPMVVSKLP